MLSKKEFIAIDEINQYKKFAFKGDIMKMSMAFILGASINKVVNSVGCNIVNPIINFILIKPNSIWSNLNIELDKNIKIEVGSFLNNFFEFLVTSIILYIVYIKIIGSFVQEKENTKHCKFCMSEINKYAKRCPNCTTKFFC